MNKKIETKLKLILLLLIASAMFFSALDFIIPSEFSRFSDGEAKNCFLFSVCEKPESSSSKKAFLLEDTEASVTTINADAKLLGVVPLKEVKVNVFDKIEVYPGGMPFGVKLYTQGLVVVGFADIDCESGSKAPAYDAGIRVNDVITKINGTDVTTSEEFVSSVEGSKGKIEITYIRDGNEYSTLIKPSISRTDGKLKTGMWIRDSTAGIGTITFIMPESNAFVGLGHGICDSETGEILPLMRGIVADVSISGIVKGAPGAPGELKGFFTENRTGVLVKNTEAGVLGYLNKLPENLIPEEKMPIGLRSDVEEGNAYIWCTLDESGPQKYGIKITSVNNAGNNSSFEIQVTDESLIEKTGGIVQGMSGSPIIQNGKIIGAVTHVMINDPLRGYGIYIEKMLEITE